MTTATFNGGPAKGSWSDQKEKLKLKFPTLTDNDLHYESGRKENMLDQISKKVGKTRSEINQILDKA